NIGGWRIDLLATDISTEVLEKAKAGIYSQFEVQRGLPIQLLIKYFTQVGDCWQIAPDIRAMVQFRPFNLLHDFSSLGPFDLVFCRNVLIYFDQDTKSSVLERIARIIERDGYLVLGAAETVVGLTDSFKPVPDRRGLYMPNLAAKRTIGPRLAVVGGREHRGCADRPPGDRQVKNAQRKTASRKSGRRSPFVLMSRRRPDARLRRDEVPELLQVLLLLLVARRQLEQARGGAAENVVLGL